MLKILSVPGRLLVASSSLMLSVPLAAVQTVISSRAPWWNLPYSAMGMWSASVALIVFPIGVWTAGGRRWALHLATIFGMGWILLSGGLAIRSGNFALGLFTLVLSGYWLAAIAWIRREMGRSFFDPRMAWYQGLPLPIPSLTCELSGSEFRVSRIDRDGAFLYRKRDPFKESPPPGIPSKGPLSARFRFRDLEIECSGDPVTLIEPGAGVGIRFTRMGADSRKKLGDFVELLEGEGHAR